MNHSLQTTLVRSPFGLIKVQHEGMTLRRVSVDANSVLKDSEGDRCVIDQFQAYFDDASHPFRFDCHSRGTAYQTRVWKALGDIPVGETQTYGQLAKRLGSGPRAVAQACRTNPLPVVVPCHRVVSATGVGGYMGTTTGPAMAIKHWLLSHERG